MISYEHRCVFVHIPKTGGQSVEQVFLQEHGLSWKERAPLLMRPNDDPARGPAFLAHLYADEYVRLGYMTQEEFDGYLKFAVVRNPYERLISEWIYRHQTRVWRTPLDIFLRMPFGSDDFSDFARHMAPQARYVTGSDGKLIVDRIVHFENFKPEAEAVFAEIFGRPRELPHRNKARGEKPARIELAPRHRRLIAKRYAADFELFGYDPDAPCPR